MRSDGRARATFPVVRALAAAGHLGPSLVVTTLTTVLALRAGVGARAGWVAAALLAGQLSIGWGNDLVDAERDRAAARHDKPLVTGELRQRTVRGAALTALGAAVVLSAPLGLEAAAAHLAGVGLGWAYNLGLKRTPASLGAYAGAFALVPVIAGFAARPPQPPPWWLIAAAACLGSAAHCVQVLGDEAADARTGVRGLPQRLGPRRSLLLAALLLAAAAALLESGSAQGSTRPLTGAALLAAVGTAAAGMRGHARAALAATVAAAALLAAALVLAG